MNHTDDSETSVLNCALAWAEEGWTVTLVTVVATWGSSPRPPGSMLAIRGDGRFCGSVSGGCVEYDLVDAIVARRGESHVPELFTYGLSGDDARRNRIPCGGTLQVLVEQVRDVPMLRTVCQVIAARQRIVRTVQMSSGRSTLREARANEQISIGETQFQMIHGPCWRVFIVGAGELSHYFALQARMLGYQVTVIEARDDYIDSWTLPEVPVLKGMPDDVLRAQTIDSRTAVVALTHDPVLDDLALWEALRSDAFYVGALGSAATSEKRRQRLAGFDLTDAEIGRLIAPIGLPIKSRTPPEIAVSIAAQITEMRNRTATSPRHVATPSSSLSGSADCTIA